VGLEREWKASSRASRRARSLRDAFAIAATSRQFESRFREPFGRGFTRRCSRCLRARRLLSPFRAIKHAPSDPSRRRRRVRRFRARSRSLRIPLVIPRHQLYLVVLRIPHPATVSPWTSEIIPGTDIETAVNLRPRANRCDKAVFSARIYGATITQSARAEASRIGERPSIKCVEKKGRGGENATPGCRFSMRRNATPLDERSINYRPVLIGRLIKSATAREPAHARFVTFEYSLDRPDFSTTTPDKCSLDTRSSACGSMIDSCRRSFPLPSPPCL